MALVGRRKREDEGEDVYRCRQSMADKVMMGHQERVEDNLGEKEVADEARMPYDAVVGIATS
jgi:hypothetical protein